MTQNELNCAVARAAGESVRTIAKMGFSPLTLAFFQGDYTAATFAEGTYEGCWPTSWPTSGATTTC